jgi:hypothetical protein
VIAGSEVRRDRIVDVKFRCNSTSVSAANRLLAAGGGATLMRSARITNGDDGGCGNDAMLLPIASMVSKRVFDVDCGRRNSPDSIVVVFERSAENISML